MFFRPKDGSSGLFGYFFSLTACTNKCSGLFLFSLSHVSETIRQYKFQILLASYSSSGRTALGKPRGCGSANQAQRFD